MTQVGRWFLFVWACAAWLAVVSLLIQGGLRKYDAMNRDAMDRAVLFQTPQDGSQHRWVFGPAIDETGRTVRVWIRVCQPAPVLIPGPVSYSEPTPAKPTFDEPPGIKAEPKSRVVYEHQPDGSTRTIPYELKEDGEWHPSPSSR